jgi:hypothetical protein
VNPNGTGRAAPASPDDSGARRLYLVNRVGHCDDHLPGEDGPRENMYGALVIDPREPPTRPAYDKAAVVRFHSRPVQRPPALDPLATASLTAWTAPSIVSVPLLLAMAPPSSR